MIVITFRPADDSCARVSPYNRIYRAATHALFRNDFLFLFRGRYWYACVCLCSLVCHALDQQKGTQHVRPYISHFSGCRGVKLCMPISLSWKSCRQREFHLSHHRTPQVTSFLVHVQPLTIRDYGHASPCASWLLVFL